MIYFKISTQLTKGNTLPYQETQAFKDVICEFRNKVIGTEKSLISLSQSADKHKDLRQLFPPKNEDRREVTTIFNKVINKFKVNQVIIMSEKLGKFRIRKVKADYMSALSLLTTECSNYFILVT